MTQSTKTFRDHFLSVYQSAAADFAAQSADGGNTEGVQADGSEFVEAATEVAAARAAQRSETSSVETEEGLADVPKICAGLGIRYLEALVSGDTARASEIKEHMQGAPAIRDGPLRSQSTRSISAPAGCVRKFPMCGRARSETGPFL